MSKINNPADTSNLVPYTGANQNVDLGTNDFTVDTNTLVVDSSEDKVGIGVTSPDDTLDVKGPATGSDTVVQIENDQTHTSLGILRGLSPNIASGASTYLTVGKEASNNNWAALSFNYDGDGSTSNYGSLGLYGQDPTLKFYPTGDVEIENDLTCDGTIIIDDITTGDPQIRFALSGAVQYSFGVDDSDNDVLKIGGGSGVSTSTHLFEFDENTGTVGPQKAQFVYNTGGTFTAGDTSPSVQYYNRFRGPSGGRAYSITTFDNGTDGQIIYINFGSVQVTVVDQSQGGGNDIYLSGGNNFISTQNSTLTLIRESNKWLELSRMQY